MSKAAQVEHGDHDCRAMQTANSTHTDMEPQLTDRVRSSSKSRRPTRTTNVWIAMRRARNGYARSSPDEQLLSYRDR